MQAELCKLAPRAHALEVVGPRGRLGRERVLAARAPVARPKLHVDLVAQREVGAQSGTIRSIDISKDGRLVAVGGRDKLVAMYAVDHAEAGEAAARGDRAKKLTMLPLGKLRKTRGRGGRRGCGEAFVPSCYHPTKRRRRWRTGRARSSAS